MDLRILKSLNNGLTVLERQYPSAYGEVRAALWLSGPSISLKNLTKYIGRFGYSAIASTGRSFTKGRVEVVWDAARAASKHSPDDGSHEVTIVLIQTADTRSLAQIEKARGGKPALIVQVTPNSEPSREVVIGLSRAEIRAFAAGKMRQRYSIDKRAREEMEYSSLVYVGSDGKISMQEWIRGIYEERRDRYSTGIKIREMLDRLPAGVTVLAHIHTHTTFYEFGPKGARRSVSWDNAPAEERMRLNVFSDGDRGNMINIDDRMAGVNSEGNRTVYGHLREKAGYGSNWVESAEGRWVLFREDFEMYVTTQDGTLLYMKRDREWGRFI